MVQNKAPQTHPETKDGQAQSWVEKLLNLEAEHRRWKSLPFFMTIAVFTIAFPIGLWSKFDMASLADSSTPVITAKAIANANATSQQSPESSSSAAGVVIAAFHLVDANQSKDFAVTIPPGQKCTVANALQAADVSLNQYDRVSPTLDQPLISGATVTVTRVVATIRKQYVTYKPEMRYQLTTKLSPGTKQIKQFQRAGKVEITERIWTKNGKVTFKEVVGRKTVAQAQDKIVLLGVPSALMPGKIPYHNRYAAAFNLSARGGSPRQRMESAAQPGTLRRLRAITLHSTAYSNSPAENGGSTHTATGMPVVYGVAAVDPRVIPLGTKLYVEGYGFAFACDTGSAIKGHRIDLAMPSGRMNAWGRRTVKAWVLGP